MRYCIAHNPLLLQPLGHWFTLISRKYEHLAVGSSSKDLLALVGFLGCEVALLSPFVPLLYHNLGDLSRGFFIFFRLSFRALVSAASLAYPLPKVETLGSVVPPLDIISIPQTALKCNRQIIQIMGE